MADRVAGLGGIVACVGFVILAFGIGPGCTQLGLSTASKSLSDPQFALPEIASDTAGVPLSKENWPERREELLQAFADHVYGPYPQGLTGRLVSSYVIDENFRDGRGRLEELTIAIAEGDNAPTFKIALALPVQATPDQPVPLIIAQNFAGNRAAMGHKGVSRAGGRATGDDMDNPVITAVAQLIFGAHIAEAPLDEILDRGYAFAAVFPSELAPDSRRSAPAALEQIGTLTSDKTAPEGVLAVWAAMYGWSIDVLDQNPRIDAKRTAVWGHSRHGKSALLAAAHDERIEATISHQSGTGGATLSRSLAGESVAQITKSYPHWFSPSYAAYGDDETRIPVDQHQLLALVAPRPVLLGNGWKDVWSDPNGAFRAALAADPVYEMLGAEGVKQSGLSDGDYLSGELAFQIRSGAHGVRKADWRAFLDFLDRWFKPDA